MYQTVGCSDVFPYSQNLYAAAGPGVDISWLVAV